VLRPFVDPVVTINTRATVDFFKTSLYGRIKVINCHKVSRLAKKGWIGMGRFVLILINVSCCLGVGLGSARADVPYPSAPVHVDVHHYEKYCFIEGENPVLPANYTGGNVWKYTSKAPDGSPFLNDPGELYGVTGMSVDKAWEITTGRPDVVIAVIDSGIRWQQPNITRKFYLNRRELPLPENSTDHDRNQDGVFNMEDYVEDERVVDWNGNGFKDPEDLIHAFSDDIDDDENGYTDDICGWDMVDDDNDPYDDVDYGHGTGESEDSCGEAYSNSTSHFPGTCPNCMILPIRVGLSFVADDTSFGRAVIFAVDSGAHVVQEALGTINGSSLAQRAIRYAAEKDVPVIASAADESSMHQNLPAAHEGTINLNSVTRFESGMVPESYLYLNGCTNYGGNIAASVSSTSCSSEAVGRGAGIAGLIISAAKNEIAKGNLSTPLTANEVKQIITMSADDIDFSDDRRVEFPIFKTRRFQSGPGWDQYFGYGRVNARKAVQMVSDLKIPPEADVSGPLWFETLDPARTPDVPITGHVANSRGGAFTYSVAYGRGIQPLESEWKKIFQSGALESPRDGVLGTWHIRPFLDEVSFPPDEINEFTFTIRVTVVDRDNPDRKAESRKTVYLHHDPQLKKGFPRHLGSSGEAPVVMADLDGDNQEDMIVSTTDGWIFALAFNGTAVAGWPVHTDLLAHRYPGSNAYRSGAVDAAVYEAIGFGGVAIGDLDGNGDPEVVAASLYGKIYVWEHDGTMRDGFPVTLVPAYSLNPGFTGSEQTDARDKYNRRLFGVVSAPVLADMDRDGRLDIICAALDNHVYVWDADGKSLPGWPVLVIDDDRFDVADPVTHRIEARDPAGTRYTGKIVSTPAVGDIDNDGFPEIVVGTNEQYREPMNVSALSLLIDILIEQEVLRDIGNARLYALHHDGERHPGGPFVDGWPVKIALLMTELLPYVGSGIPGAPIMADVDHNGTLEIAVLSTVGPVYLLNGDGSSYYGMDNEGDYHTMRITALSALGRDMPTIPAMGSPLFADLSGDGRISCVAPSAGLRKLIDANLPGEQMNNENHISAWNTLTGKLLPGFPVYMDDLQFFAGPSAADLNGDGLPEIIGGSGGFLVRAYDGSGRAPDGWPKFTGQWVISTPGTGDIDGDGLLEVAVMTRSGNLYVWESLGDACSACSTEWKTFQHDMRHTGVYGRDVIAPARPLDFAVAEENGSIVLSWSASGDDGYCGRAAAYEIRGYERDGNNSWKDAPVRKIIHRTPAPATRIEITMAAPDPGIYGSIDYYGIQAVDEAGNLSRVVSVSVSDESIEMPSEAPGTLAQQSYSSDSGLCFLTTAIPMTE
jgi:hypothetical protein